MSRYYLINDTKLNFSYLNWSPKQQTLRPRAPKPCFATPQKNQGFTFLPRNVNKQNDKGNRQRKTNCGSDVPLWHALGLKRDGFWIEYPKPRTIHSTPCGLPSRNRPNGQFLDGCPQGVITTYFMRITCVLSIWIIPKINKFWVTVRPMHNVNRSPFGLILNQNFVKQYGHKELRFR
jgi:hypothetical protein